MKRIFLLDSSGSMHTRINDTIGGFNSFVDDQKKDGGTLSLYTFSDIVKNVYMDVPIDEVKPLTVDDYKPSGNTALYDAMGHILNEYQGSEGTFVIMTDGEENSSRKYTHAHVKDLVKLSKLTIIYAGADIEDAKQLNIDTTFKYNGNRTPEMFRLLSQTVSCSPGPSASDIPVSADKTLQQEQDHLLPEKPRGGMSERNSETVQKDVCPPSCKRALSL